MKKLKRNIEYAKNKVVGAVKETAGKVTGNAQLELKGKLQSSQADLKKNLNVADKIEDIKENLARGLNKRIDKKKGK